MNGYHDGEIIIFRAKEDIEPTAEALAGHGFRVRGFPVIERVCAGSDMIDIIRVLIGDADYISFSSRESVRCLSERIPIDAFVGKHVLASGPSTAMLLSEIGVDVRFAPERGGIRSVLEWLSGMEPSTLLIIGSSASENDVSELVLNGFTIIEVASHITRESDIRVSERDISEARYMVFFSPSEVRAFSRAVRGIPPEVIRERRAICIGERTYDELTGLFDSVIMAKVNSVEGIAEILEGDMVGQKG